MNRLWLCASCVRSAANWSRIAVALAASTPASNQASSHRTQSYTEYATGFHRVGKWRCAQGALTGASVIRAKRQKMLAFYSVKLCGILCVTLCPMAYLLDCFVLDCFATVRTSPAPAPRAGISIAARAVQRSRVTPRLARAQPKVRSEGRLGTNLFAFFVFFAVQSSLLRHPHPTMTPGADCPSAAAAVSKVFNRK